MVVAWLGLVAGLAHAGTLASPVRRAPWTEAAARPGLVVAEIHTPEACDGVDAWLDAELVKVAAALHVDVVRYDWRADATDVSTLLGEGLRAVPQRIARRDGVELDRLCGCASPDALRGWLVGVAGGKTAADALADAGTGVPDAARGIERANAHLCAQRPDAAMATLLDLWVRIPPTDTAGPLRITRLATEAGKIAKRYPSTRPALVAVRDATEGLAPTSSAAFDDLITLNRVLGEDDRTLAWYDAHRLDPAAADVVEHARTGIFRLRSDRGDWDGAAKEIGDLDRWLAATASAGVGAALRVDMVVALRKVGDTAGANAVVRAIGKPSPSAACAAIARWTATGVASKAEAALAKRCDVPATLAAWEAALP